ncbi:hypothetical protein CHLRE_11g467796v5 [Chlamydomonas reinhardtii]|uniref:Uncharacterized protein n=1 Tax=Chlamydomonas reinhardtii TaxID=3055 RepID=A0A2K3D824_CHLRE|nr:uncharacterized protein CHLRE_11g467796v5 [Chlamydomonas reinhardtii]PNW76683.1 hypothetical protein CHLRE_11g467796v5 [Chlamydomonas reinhardtii]
MRADGGAGASVRVTGKYSVIESTAEQAQIEVRSASAKAGVDSTAATLSVDSMVPLQVLSRQSPNAGATASVGAASPGVTALDPAMGAISDLTEQSGLPGMILGSADRPAAPVPTSPMRILFLIMRFCDDTDNGPVTTTQVSDRENGAP